MNSCIFELACFQLVSLFYLSIYLNLIQKKIISMHPRQTRGVNVLFFNQRTMFRKIYGNRYLYLIRDQNRNLKQMVHSITPIKWIYQINIILLLFFIYLCLMWLIIQSQMLFLKKKEWYGLVHYITHNTKWSMKSVNCTIYMVDDKKRC